MESRNLDLPVTPSLQWLPDESLFSLCSRHHRLWGHPHAWQTSQLLFGGRRAGTQHDFPASLDDLADRTGGQWGTAESIATARTLLRFYLPFLDEQSARQTVSAMRSRSVAHLKFRLGLLTSRFRAHHPLKACPDCMLADLIVHGWAYWHLAHQYPGVWICPVHETSLLESTVKSTGVERFHWHLPTKETLRPMGTLQPPIATSRLPALARLICRVVDCERPVGWLGGATMEQAVEAAFAARGWVTRQDRLRIDPSAHDFLAYCTQLVGPDELRALPTTISTARSQVSRLRRSILEGTHPLRILVAASWLFGDFGSLLAAIDTDHATLAVTAPETTSKDYADGAQDRRHGVVIEAMRSGQSARTAAAMVGINIGTARAWAVRAGLTVTRRPKILTALRLGAVIADLTVGADKQAVARRHGVSVATITRVLRTEVGLRATWRQAQWDAAQHRARESWLATQHDHPGAGIKLLRALDPSAYAWLYRHDRAWLKANGPPHHFADPGSRRNAVDWLERDRLLHDHIERAVLQLGTAHPGQRLRLWQIYQIVPDLRPKLRVLHRLPLTKQLLEHVIGRTMPSPDDAALFS